MNNIKSDLLDDIKEHISDKVKDKDKDKEESTAPLVQVDELKKNRSEPGKGEIVIGGVPVDVFSIENMVIKVSPSDMKTLLRYDNARVIEYMRNTARPKVIALGGTNWNILYVLAIAGGIGLVVFLFWEDIIGLFSGIF